MMNFRPANRFDLKTMLVCALCVCGAAAGFYFLYRDMNVTGRSGSGPALVKIERRDAKVRRKAAGSYVWSNVRVADELFRRDAIQTSVDSSATLRFNDGSLLEMNENSLVLIDDVRDLSLNFLHGSFVVRRESGESRVTVGNDGKSKVEDLPAQLIRPASFASFFDAEGKSRIVDFAWKLKSSREPGKKVVLQISNDAQFSAARTRSIEIRSPNNSRSEEFTPGRYFWRLAEDTSGHELKALSRVSQFSLQEASAARPLWPGGGQRLALFGTLTPLRFRWLSPVVDARGATGAEMTLEIARDPAFRDLVIRQSIRSETDSAMIPELPSGSFYWRIRSRYGDLAVVSAAEAFVLTRTRALAIDLTFPDEGAPIESRRQTRFNWNCEGDPTDFLLEVQDAGGKIIQSARVRGKSAIWTEPPDGQYRWHVVAYDHASETAAVKIGESPWRNFSVYRSPIVLQAPSPDREFLFWSQPPAFSFRWLRAPEDERPGNRYRLDVSTDPMFRSGVVSKSVEQAELASADLVLPQGKLWWRVSLVDGAGRIVKVSPVSPFVYRTYATLGAPRAAGPESGKVFDVRAHPEDTVATWSEVDGAVGYEFTLYSRVADVRAPASGVPAEKLVLRKQTGDRRIELKNLPQGSYSWTVRAIDRLKRPGAPSRPGEFSVTFGTPLAAPKVISPGVQ